MPIYEYKCERGHQFEVLQRMADDALTKCTVCEASVQRVFHPVAVHFKGSGFYNTDYGKQKRGKDAKNDSGSSSGDSSDGASSKPDSSSKSDASSKSDSSSGSGSSSSSSSSKDKKPSKASSSSD